MCSAARNLTKRTIGLKLSEEFISTFKGGVQSQKVDSGSFPGNF